MIRKVKPGNGCCLYFPHRKKGSQVITGEGVWVWLWEEWKHIKLGLYTVQIPESEIPEESKSTEIPEESKSTEIPEESKSVMVPTSEDLWCKVTAIFRIHVGGYPDEGRERRLALATDTCPAGHSTNIKDKDFIPLEFFKNWTTGSCNSSIRDEIKKSSFVKLIESTDYRIKVVKAIRDNLEDQMKMIGLVLVESNVVIEPQKPEGPLISEEIYNKWQSIRNRKDAADIVRQRAENDKEKQVETLSYEKEDHKKALAAKARESERQRDIKEGDEKLKKEQVMLSYARVINDLNHQSQLYDLQLKAELDEEAIQKRINCVNKELEEKKLKIEFNELAKSSANLEAEVEKIKGTVSAEVTEINVLAESASERAMQKILLEALPKVLEAANKPLEKMGEIRAINITGLSDKADNQNSSGSILAAVTFLPLLKEIMHFISDKSLSPK